MKKLLLSMMAVASAFVAKADYTVTLDFTGWNFPGAETWKSNYEAHTVEFDHAVVDFVKADRQAEGNAIDDCPVTKGFDITVTADAQIVNTSVTFKQWGSKTKTAQLWNGDNMLAETSAFAFDNVVVGASSYVIKFTETNNQIGLQQIVLTLSGDAPVPGQEVESPVITPATGTYTEPQTVTITAAEGLSIYYTLDGSAPNDACILYEAPFEVSQTTTVKAVAYNDEDVASKPVTSVITIVKSIANTLETAYTTAEAIALIDDPSSNLKDTVYVKGVVSNVDSYSSTYHNLNYWLDNKSFEIYAGLGLNGIDPENDSYLGVGDEVIVKGVIKKYNSTYEMDKNNYIVQLVKAEKPAVSIKNTPETAYTVARAFELVDAGEDLDSKVYVKGIISTINEVDTGNYGNATYFISDDGTTTKEFEVYRGYSVANNKFTREDEIKVGDVVIVYGKITLFHETYEFTSGSYIYSLNGSTSAIQTIKEEKELVIDPKVEAVYNICGKRVFDISKKGIYIVNGKKYVVR